MFSFGFHQAFHTGVEAWYDYFFSKVRRSPFFLNRAYNIIFFSALNTPNR